MENVQDLSKMGKQRIYGKIPECDGKVAKTQVFLDEER